MAQVIPRRMFSERELAAFREFAAKQSQKLQTDLADAQHERKLTLARAEHFRHAMMAAKLFEQLGDPQLPPDRRARLWAELGEPNPANPEIGAVTLKAAARLSATPRRGRARAKQAAPTRSDATRHAAVRLYLDGKASAKDLATRLGVTPETIRLWVRKDLEQQGKRPQARRGVPEATRIEASRLAVSGSHTIAQLAEKYSCHPTTVARWVREYRAAEGIPRPTQSKVPNEVKSETLRLIFEGGLAPTIAARQTGVSANTAQQWANLHEAEHGTPIPKYDRSRRHPYSPRLKARAIRLIFETGKRVPEAARELGLPVATARVWAEEHQRETSDAMPGLAAITRGVREQAVRAHQELGVPIEEIAERLHVQPRTVKTWVYSCTPTKEVPIAPYPAPRGRRRTG